VWMPCYCADVGQSIENAREEAAKQKAVLDEELNRCCELVAEAYDKYVNYSIIRLCPCCRLTEVNFLDV